MVLEDIVENSKNIMPVIKIIFLRSKRNLPLLFIKNVLPPYRQKLISK